MENVNGFLINDIQDILNDILSNVYHFNSDKHDVYLYDISVRWESTGKCKIIVIFFINDKEVETSYYSNNMELFDEWRLWRKDYYESDLDKYEDSKSFLNELINNQRIIDELDKYMYIN